MQNKTPRLKESHINKIETFSIYDLKKKLQTTVIIFDQVQLDYILDRLVEAIKFGKYEF